MAAQRQARGYTAAGSPRAFPPSPAAPLSGEGELGTVKRGGGGMQLGADVPREACMRKEGGSGRWDNEEGMGAGGG